MEIIENELKKFRSETFVPMLYLKNLAAAIEFYKKAFDATELRTVRNSDGTVHVSEMSIASGLFRMHEEGSRDTELSPSTVGATTVLIGLLVDDPDKTIKNVVAAGGSELSPAKDYDYGYRQGTVSDPFGHHWLIEKKMMI